MDFQKKYRWRHQFKRFTCAYFDNQNFIEVDTPIIVTMPGAEVHLDYFATNWRDQSDDSHDLFLRSSPEIHLKQAIASGVEKVYSLAPCFRNGGEHTPWHRPEFYMLEWYEVAKNLDQLQEFTIRFIQEASRFAKTMGYKPKICSEIMPVTMSVKDAFSKYADIDLRDADPNLAIQAKQKGVFSIVGNEDFETAFFKVFFEKIEPSIIEIPFLVLRDYPASQSVLAENKGGWSSRFEIYIYGLEICNAFTELRSRGANLDQLEKIAQKRVEIGKKDHPTIDQDYLQALGSDLPVCVGNALGFDRLLALVSGVNDIAQVLPFAQRTPFDKSTKQI